MLHRADTPLLHSLRHAIDALATAHSHRDLYAHHHEDRVAELAVSIGAGMGLSPTRLEVLGFAARVHDIGKLGIPTEIVSKPGKLSDPENALIQTHSAIGHDILLQLRSAFPIADIVLQHHERLDGSGYPRGLKTVAIMEEARILAVADVFDAMSSYRPYRAALSEDFVLGEIHKMAAIKLDQKAVDACTRYILSGKATHSAAASRGQLLPDG
jgi:HD-GYP domain-containing protein (c-di-GMP phosphodiesterase class II)